MRYHHQDTLSMRVKTGGSGAVKGTQSHLPYGEDGSGGVTGESDTRRFTSYERDAETGSDHAINRQYSQSTARFLRPDPLAGSLSDPQSLNRYAYCGNDPVNMADPLGLKPYDWTTDASQHGPGVYLDGSLLSNGMEQLAFSIMGMEGTALGPGRLVRWNWNKGIFEFLGVDDKGKLSWGPLAPPKLNPLLQWFGRLVAKATVWLELIGNVFETVLRGSARSLTTLAYNIRFVYVAVATGLWAYVKDFDFNYEKRTWKVSYAGSVGSFLSKSPYFGGPGIGWLHIKDVGWLPLDFRSHTLILPGFSMQVVYNWRNPDRGFADFDRYGSYEDVVGLLGHFFLEVIPHVFN